jgi:hypothetical protein
MKRSIPKVPIFKSSPASIIEPEVGASTCASGNQVCNGTRGTLNEKPIKNNNQSTSCVVSSRVVIKRVGKNNVLVFKNKNNNPSKRKKEPAAV